MKKSLFISLVVLLFISCDEVKPSEACMDYQIEIQSLETQINNQFQENGKLKEQLESATEYIQLLEWENDSLSKSK